MAARSSKAQAAAGRRLVIVESPAKARKISGYLGEGYDVQASAGHIRDLPSPSELPPAEKKGRFARFAVDVDAGFEPFYAVDADKKSKVAELKRLLKDADELLLATDEDREGEAIAWHLKEVLNPKVPVRRMVFHEITKEAILRALDSTRDLDTRLVDAQETRRILDRLYGYEVSPVLWRKVRHGLSAGRVQSVATRLVVQRERERRAFVSAAYWDIVGTFEAHDTSFTARLVEVDARKVATGRDFSSEGTCKSQDCLVLDEGLARGLVSSLTEAHCEIRSVENKPYRRSPAPAFITSTLQQEAANKLRFSAQTTMSVAQRLYENGFITYMRTDSTNLSQSAIAAAREQAAQLYGAQSVPDAPRTYARKAKNAQEAHEAIRPAGDSFRTPGEVAGQLSREEFALYELIWKRTLACQMADATGQTASIRLTALASDGREVTFAASGTVITFRGFLAAYDDVVAEEPKPGTTEAATATQVRLPAVVVGDRVLQRGLDPQPHQTNPPARYTEASLIKAMEELGIGRPSTYEPTIRTILAREYVFKKGSALVPSWLAFSVVSLLEQHLATLIDYDFTAAMEEDLDKIAGGQADRVQWLTRFYFGSAPASVPDQDALGGLKPLVENLGSIDPREVNSIDIGEGMTLRVGRYGPFLQRGEDKASVPADLPPDELTAAVAQQLLDAPNQPRELGKHPDTGLMIVAKAGRFGPYVSEVVASAEGDAPTQASSSKTKTAKPRTASLFSSMTLDSVTLEDAIALLTLPRVVGVDPADGQEITAQNGRYGPYLKKGSDSRTLEGEELLLNITLPQALEIYAQPKTRGGRAASAPLRELGDDPATGKPMVIKDGRFGPYVTDGETNATLRSGDSAQDITPQRAAELLADKRAKGPAPKKTRRASSSAKSTKKPSAKSGAKSKAKIEA